MALNVLLIIADQWRWDCLGVAGNTVIRTPHLDALAHEGALFSKCFAQTAPCGPSRMSLYTSRYMCSTRAVNNYTPLADADENLAQHVHEAGYRTAILGYNDYSPDPRILPIDDRRRWQLSYSNFLPGFDETYLHEYHSPGYFQWLREKGYPEEWCGPKICSDYDVPPHGLCGHLPLRFPAHYKAGDSESAYLTERACEFIRRQAGKGWFLSLNYIKPHPPRICPSPFNDMYDPADMPPATRKPAELNSTHPYLRLAHSTPVLEYEHELRETQACYYGMISEIDTNVGVILEILRETGQWDNTLIVFTSDHGEYLGDHYFMDKAHFYDSTMRVPLIIRDPGHNADRTRGSVCNDFCELLDVAPTILDYLNIPKPDRFQGDPLLRWIRGDPNRRTKQQIHFEYDFRGRHLELNGEDPDACVLWVVRDDAYKYVQFGLESFPSLLFDLRNDPGEFINLADRSEHACTVAAYCQKLLRWRMKQEDQRMEHWTTPLRNLD